ncbi:polysaccharide deacetylase family protein [Oscillospiraceae bacterium OttesenSCG-928-G22]|nr:polysaccharide deacetylase family protein [Oscillospiraceae bacterium OttesenSCG-928-G22]
MNSRLKKPILFSFFGICLVVLFAAFFRFYAASAPQNLYTRGGQPPVLLYHHFVEDESALTEELTGLAVTAGKFEADLTLLLDAGYTPISTAEYFSNRRQNGDPLPEMPVILQFDDGYESNYTIAYPILKRHAVPTDIFLITDFVGRKSDPKLTFLTWDEIAEMRESGLVEFYSHGTDHSRYGGYPTSDFRKMLLESEETLDRHIEGREFRIFAYPTGDTSDQAMQTAHEAGMDAQMLLDWGCSRALRNVNFLLRHGVRQTDDPLQIIDALAKRVEFYQNRRY